MKKKYANGSNTTLDPTTNLPEEKRNETGVKWNMPKKDPFADHSGYSRQSYKTGGVKSIGDLESFDRIGRSFTLDDSSIVKERALNAPMHKQFGNWAAQVLAGEIVGGTAQGFGSLYEGGEALVNWGLRESGLNPQAGYSDFSNELMRWGDNLQKQTRKKFPIYLENPNKSWDIGDDGWWFSNGVSVASSLSLMIPGMAVTRGAGYLAKMAGKSLPYWAAVGTNAMVMRNGENFREGLQVVDQARGEALSQFLNMSDEQWDVMKQSPLAQKLKNEGRWEPLNDTKNKNALADYIGSAAGSESYKVNSANIVFDIIQSAIAVKAFSGIGKTGRSGTLYNPAKPSIYRENIKAGGGTPTKLGQTSNFANYYLNPFTKGAALTGIGATSEYPEEFINFIGTEEGLRKGRVLSGSEEDGVKSFSARLKEYYNNPKAHEAGFFGVFGGGVYQSASSAVGSGVRAYKGNKDPFSKDSKVNEVKARASKIQAVKNQIDAVVNKENSPYGDFTQYTDAQVEATVDNLRKDLGRELGITAASKGNDKLVKDMVNMPEYKKLLIENNITSEEEFDVHLESLNKSIDQGIRDYYRARKRSQKHGLGPKGYKKILNEDIARQGLLSRRLEQSADAAGQIADLKTNNTEGDLGYMFAQANNTEVDLALELQGAENAKKYFEYERNNYTETVAEPDAKVLGALDSKVNRIDARIAELREQALDKELPNLNEVSDELKELHADQEVYNNEINEYAEGLNDLHKAENVEESETERQEKEKKQTAARQKELKEATKSNKKTPDTLRKEIQRLEDLRSEFDDVENSQNIIDNAIAKLNNKINSLEAKKTAKEARENPTPQNEEQRRAGVTEVESPAKTNDGTADSTEQSDKIEKEDPFVHLDLDQMLAKEAEQTIEGSTDFFAFPFTKSKDDQNNIIPEGVEAKLLRNDIKLGDKVDLLLEPSNRIGLQEGQEFDAGNIPIALQVDGETIGYLNTLQSKQKFLDGAQGRFDATSKDYDPAKFGKADIESKELELHRAQKNLEKATKDYSGLEKIRKAAFSAYDSTSDKDVKVFESTINNKTSGALIQLDTQQSISYGVIPGVDVFSDLKEVPLYYHDGANKYVLTKVGEPTTEFTREGETSFYNKDLGYTPGGFYLLLESPNSKEIPHKISTRKINNVEVERAYNVITEIADLIKKAGTSSVKTTPKIKELKEELNLITYVGKNGIEIHNDRIDINISYKDKGYTASLHMYGAPNTPQAGQALDNFNVTYKDFNGKRLNKESLFNESLGTIKNAVTRVLANRYKSVSVKELEGENSKEYFQELMTTDTFLTDIGQTKTEDGKFVSNFAFEGDSFSMNLGIDTKVTPVGQTKVTKEKPQLAKQSSEVEVVDIDRIIKETESDTGLAKALETIKTGGRNNDNTNVIQVKNVSSGLLNDNRIVIIDGWHRLAKAILDGKNKVEVVFIDKSKTQQTSEQTNLDFDTQDDDLFTSALNPYEYELLLSEGKPFYDGRNTKGIKINEAKAWLKENLPQVPVEIVEGLIDAGGGYAWGTFHKGAIQLSDIAKEGTEYHEAFHAVEHMYLNPIQRERVYKEARTVYGESLSDREIGEELAEEYREYQMMNGNAIFKLPSAIERFFGDIFRYIKHFISNGKSRAYTERLFKDIPGGRFTNQPDQRAMDWAKSQEMLPRIAGLSRKEEKQAVDVITSLTHAIRQRLVSRGEPSNAKVIYSRIKSGLKRNIDGKTIEQQDGINRVLDALGRKMKDSELWNKVSLRIQKDLNVVVKIDDTNISEEEKVLAKQNWDDSANFEENHKDKTSAKIKLAIRTTKEVADYKDGKVVLKSDNFMGMANFLDFNRVYPYLEKNLVGVRDPQHLLDRLTEMGSHDMSLLSLRDKIEAYKNSEGKNTLLAAFYHHFDKAAPNFVVNLLSRDSETGVLKNQEFFSNNNKAEQNLAQGWEDVISYNIENERYDSSKLQKSALNARRAIQKMQKEGTLTPKSSAEMVSKLLAEINVTTFDQGVDSVSKALENEFVKNIDRATEVIKKYERIVKSIGEGVFDNAGDLQYIGAIVAPYRYGLVQNSAQTIDGKIYYGITKPNFISDFFKKIKDPIVGPQLVAQLLENPRTAESPLVKQLVARKEGLPVIVNGVPELNQKNISGINFSIQDGLKEVGERKGIKYKGIKDVDWHSLNLLKYFDTNPNTVSKGFYGTHLPIPSDSGQLYYINLPKYTGNITQNEDFTYSLDPKSPLYRAIKQQIRSEKAAMKQAKELLFDEIDGSLTVKDDINQNKLVEYYHYKYNKAGEKVFLENGEPTGNAFKFYFLPAMNNDKGLVRTNGVINDETGTEQVVRFEDSVIQSYLNNELENIDLEFLEASNSIEIPRIDGVDGNPAMLEFLLNELVANEEIYNLFAGAQAFYKTATDLNKRMKQVVSPGERQSRMFTGETYKNGVIEDVFLSSAVIENKILGVEKALKNYGEVRKNAKVNAQNIIEGNPSNDIEKQIYTVLEGYLNIESTDGQGIVTVDRYVAQMEDIGRESDELYKLVKKIKSGKELNTNEIKAILQPLKGFMYANEYDSYLGMFVPRQIKYSTGVLLPQFTKDTELDKIRTWMESDKGTDELIFHSASKVGSRHVQKIHDDNNNIVLENLDKIHVEHIRNDRWQKQLDIPDHVSDTTNTLGSQIAKLIGSNLVGTYKLPGVLGEMEMSGPELLNYYNELLSENVIDSHDKLMKRLNVNETKDGFNDLTTVKEILQEELNRQEASEGMYEYTQIDRQNESKFDIPLAFGPNASKFESILSSLFTKNVTKQRFPGGTAVNFSSTFFKNAKIEESNELKMNIYEEDGNRIIEAEAVLPAWSESFFDDNGKLMDINNIPDELRTLITYRIPSAGKKAIIMIKAKAFSPRANGNIILLPNDFIVQSGMDFDIDKVNFMHKVFYKNKKGKFVVPKYGKLNAEGKEDLSRDARNNEIFEVFRSVLSNPVHYLEIVSPETFEDVTKAKENIQKVTGENDENIISGSYRDQNRLRKRNIAAKDLVGIAANYNQFTTLSQTMKLELVEPLVFKYPKSKYTISKLKSRFGDKNVKEEGNDIIVKHKYINHSKDGLNVEGRLTTEYSGQSLGASVDSVKNPSFEAFNGNTYTYPMMGAIIATGSTYNMAAYMLRQPIVKQITDMYFRNKGIVSTQQGGERFEVRERYIKELLGNQYSKVQFNTKAKNEMLVELGVDIGEFTPFNESELLNSIKKSVEMKSISNLSGNDSFIIDQLNVFENFMILRRGGEAMDDMIRATKPEAIGAGPSLTVTEELDAAQEKTYNYQIGEEIGSRIIDGNGNDAIEGIYNPSNSTMAIIPTMYKYSNAASMKLLKSQFPQYSPAVRYIVDDINQLIGKDYKGERAKLIHNFVLAKLKNNVEFFKSSKYANLLGFSEEYSVAAKVAELKIKHPKVSGEPTEILHYLNPKTSIEEREKNYGAELIDFKAPMDLANSLEDSFHDMFYGQVPGVKKEDQKEFKDLARELIQYSYHTTGLRAGRNSFAGYILPNILNSEEIRYGEKLNEISGAIVNNSRQVLNSNETIFEFFMHNWKNKDIVPIGKKQWKKNNKGEFYIAKNSPRWEAQSDGLIVENADKITKAGLMNTPFVLVPKYANGQLQSETLYFQSGMSQEDIIYIPVPKLGIPGKALNLSNEYMVHEDVYAPIDEYNSMEEAMQYAQLEYGANELISMEKLTDSISEVTRTKQSGCK